MTRNMKHIEILEHLEACDEADRLRIVQCVNACAGMDDPESEIQSLRDRLNDLRTWIIENAEDVTGQDGVKWNAIDRDEILNYLKGQDDDI